MATRHHSPIDSFTGSSPVHIHQHSATGPTGLSPSQIDTAYNLPGTGGAGKTIAIVDAYSDSTIAPDLSAFSTKFGLPVCTTSNGCFQIHPMAQRVQANSGWALEESLDVEWAHAIAPQAAIMLVEARSSSGNDLLSAISYAKSQPGVVAVSMSWGGPEFNGESSYDTDFATAGGGVQFFAAAGDSGHGVDWPAASPNVIGVGGTTLSLNPNGTINHETAWSGSGGGISNYESEPTYQSGLLPAISSGNHRAVPDVTYDADPASGVAVYDSTRYDNESGWFQVGGTSAGTPQWAAIDAINASNGSALSSSKLYHDAAPATYAKYFRDITTGSNGTCAVVCSAAPGFDFVSGLGSPLSAKF